MSEQFSVQVPMDSDRPLAEQIRRVLSDEILSGTLPPGTRLDEIALANRFDVSRTPVREALRKWPPPAWWNTSTGAACS
ncbi:GntR family transcriptional regulator [Alcanivorax sp. IO_7]|nr:GntR family transcriptional regulator [Alcanivorax sp. IO_7]